MATSAGKTAKRRRAGKPAASVSATPLANLEACIADARAAIRDRDPGPADPRNFRELMTRLPPARERLAPIYQAGMFDPIAATLTGLGETGFDRVLRTDVNNDRQGRLMLDLTQSLLQPAEGYSSMQRYGHSRNW